MNRIKDLDCLKPLFRRQDSHGIGKRLLPGDHLLMHRLVRLATPMRIPVFLVPDHDVKLLKLLRLGTAESELLTFLQNALDYLVRFAPGEASRQLDRLRQCRKQRDCPAPLLRRQDGHRIGIGLTTGDHWLVLGDVRLPANVRVLMFLVPDCHMKLIQPCYLLPGERKPVSKVEHVLYYLVRFQSLELFWSIEDLGRDWPDGIRSDRRGDGEQVEDVHVHLE
jgi:hypothetical protein